MSIQISPERAELLSLRARIVALERTVLMSIEITRQLHPEALERHMENSRKDLADAYLDETFAPDLTNHEERLFVAGKVDALMRALQSELDFRGGISTPESG
jgi:hypothetical protein